MQNFLEAVEAGYSKYKNPYHNLVHAADVLQTTYNIINSAGLMVIYFYLNFFSEIPTYYFNVFFFKWIK